MHRRLLHEAVQNSADLNNQASSANCVDPPIQSTKAKLMYSTL